jgi:hypothetical protein
MGPHVTERLSAYMDAELGEADRAQVDAHLLGCPACARHLEELRAVEAAARALPLEAPDGYFEAFSGRVRRRLEPARSRRRGYFPAWTFAAAAAVVLALLTPRLLHQPLTRPAADFRAPPPPAQAKKDSGFRDSAAGGAGAEAPPPAAGTARRRLEEQVRAQATQPPAAPAARATPATPTREHSRNAAEAPSVGYAAPPPAMDQVERTPVDGAPQARAPQARTEAESGAAARDEETKARRDKAAFGALQGRAERAPASDGRFQLLLAKTPPSSAAEARALRNAWRAFAREETTGPRADEARVRAVEAGAEAWRKGRDDKDRAEAQREGREYLARPDALQADRVREVLRALSP